VGIGFGDLSWIAEFGRDLFVAIQLRQIVFVTDYDEPLFATFFAFLGWLVPAR
jgi:hypothetical protein